MQQPKTDIEQEIITAKVSFILHGEEFSVQEKSLEGMAAFRKTLGGLAGMLASAFGPFLSSTIQDTAKRDHCPEIVGQKLIIGALRDLLPLILADGVDVAVKCLELYAPELKADIAKASYLEKVAAGMEVISICFPFFTVILVGLIKMMGRVGAMNALADAET